MHFEISISASKAEALIKKIQGDKK
jgi:hypothetical protein